jgi:hypothetical protein
MIIVAVVLGDLAFLVLRLARSAPLLHHGLVLVEDRLLRERRLGWDEAGTFQLPQQGYTKVKPYQGQTREDLSTTKGE